MAPMNSPRSGHFHGAVRLEEDKGMAVIAAGGKAITVNTVSSSSSYTVVYSFNDSRVGNGLF